MPAILHTSEKHDGSRSMLGLGRPPSSACVQIILIATDQAPDYKLLGVNIWIFLRGIFLCMYISLLFIVIVLGG